MAIITINILIQERHQKNFLTNWNYYMELLLRHYNQHSKEIDKNEIYIDSIILRRETEGSLARRAEEDFIRDRIRQEQEQEQERRREEGIKGRELGNFTQNPLTKWKTTWIS